MSDTIITCVYCGHAYPEGTPPHGAQVLTDHIKVCEKHPMRELERKYALVRLALARLAGVSGDNREEMVEMRGVVSALRLTAPDPDCAAAAVNALTALIETIPE